MPSYYLSTLQLDYISEARTYAACLTRLHPPRSPPCISKPILPTPARFTHRSAPDSCAFTSPAADDVRCFAGPTVASRRPTKSVHSCTHHWRLSHAVKAVQPSHLTSCAVMCVISSYRSSHLVPVLRHLRYSSLHIRHTRPLQPPLHTRLLTLSFPFPHPRRSRRRRPPLTPPHQPLRSHTTQRASRALART